MSTPIAEPIQELRELQRSADFKRESVSPKTTVEGWVTGGKEKFIPNRTRNLTYANVVATRYSVTGTPPTPGQTH